MLRKQLCDTGLSAEKLEEVRRQQKFSLENVTEADISSSRNLY
jgi:hypothetical protein